METQRVIAALIESAIRISKDSRLADIRRIYNKQYLPKRPPLPRRLTRAVHAPLSQEVRDGSMAPFALVIQNNSNPQSTHRRYARMWFERVLSRLAIDNAEMKLQPDDITALGHFEMAVKFAKQNIFTGSVTQQGCLEELQRFKDGKRLPPFGTYVELLREGEQLSVVCDLLVESLAGENLSDMSIAPQDAPPPEAAPEIIDLRTPEFGSPFIAMLEFLNESRFKPGSREEKRKATVEALTMWLLGLSTGKITSGVNILEDAAEVIGQHGKEYLTWAARVVARLRLDFLIRLLSIGATTPNMKFNTSMYPKLEQEARELAQKLDDGQEVPDLLRFVSKVVQAVDPNSIGKKRVGYTPNWRDNIIEAKATIEMVRSYDNAQR